MVIADEVSYVKNFKPKRSKRLKKLQTPYRWGLTGQPVENKAEEVFSIMQWVDRDVLGDFKTFDSTFVNRNPWGGVRAYKNLPTLHKALKTAMVRRTREQVKDQLPAVMEESWLVDFDATGAKLYRHIAAGLLDDLEEALASYGNFDVTGFYTGNDMGEPARLRVRSPPSWCACACCATTPSFCASRPITSGGSPAGGRAPSTPPSWPAPAGWLRSGPLPSWTPPWS